MQKIITIVGFIISGIFAVVSVASFASSPFLGIFSIALAIVVFPKTTGFIQKKFKYEVPRKLTAGTIGLLLLAIVVTLSINGSTPSQTTEIQNQQAAVTSTPEVTALIPSDQTTTSDAQAVESQQKNTVPTSAQEQSSDLIRVASVVDGDTIKVLIKGVTKTVRLIGIDTPETVDPRKPVQCFGKEASDKAKPMLSNKMVRLESDPTQGDLDKYQRLLRYVFLEDGTFFNKTMIAEGYAHEYTYDIPYKYQVEFKAAERVAREAQLGLWSLDTCNGTTNATTEAMQMTSTPTSATQPSGHTFYLSTYYTAKYYYCDTDDGWKSLSPKYLKSYSSEQALLEDYPVRTIHEACR